MSTSDSYYIGKRSISAGAKVHPSNKVVTPKIMRIDDELFASLVKAGRIKKGTPPVPVKAKATRPVAKDVQSKIPPPGGKVDDPPVPVLRADRIEAAIKDLFKEDGETRKSDDDFTKDDKPTTEALNFKFDKIEDEPEITAVDRDEAWSAYLEKHTEPNGSD
jgi:hypothetical protein